MIVIQSQYDDPTTDDVLDWLYYLDPSIKVQRLNGTQEISSLEYLLNSECEEFNILTNDSTINHNNFSSYWYRRGLLSLNSSIYKSVYAKLGLDGLLQIRIELDHLIECLNDTFNEKYNGINRASDNETNKIQNLKIAKNCGLKIPETLICTCFSSLQNFLQKYPFVISKPIRSGYLKTKDILIHTSTKQISIDTLKELKEKIKGNSFLPSLFQQYIEKKFELRIFFFEKTFYPMAIFSQQNEKTKIDFRNYDDSRPNRCVPFKLPLSIEEKLNSFVTHINMRSGSIDIIYSINNEYVFLEINPIGQFQWLDKGCNYYIDKKIASYLINNTVS
ncbi:MAG: grasp-with-spasm system ATP-grasp peptide maturase [Bacteroidetes bacterium]|nr:grasp-with-spasm system ATP-grasp peptide maturase [Bacteroidota bacterium]